MDLNTILMRSTFRIAGDNALGTIFIMGRPVEKDPSKLAFVLITAAHVLEDMKGSQAVLFLRKEVDGLFQKLPLTLKIRDGDKPLWTKHPKADVAVMYVSIPKEADIQLLPIDLLASDATLTEFEIHPGDALSCLGYPYGAEANDAGFPILRSGQIASYPLTPSSKYPTFLFDFRVFGGNSGGPVFFIASNRTYGGATKLGTTIQFVAGLVSQEQMIEEEVKSLTETRKMKHALSLAVVIKASLIKEAIELLPPAR